MPVQGCEMPFKQLAEGCRITKLPENLDHVVCNRAGTVMVRGVHVPIEYGLHKHRVMDELQTICNRHLMKTPDPELGSEACKEFKKVIYGLSRQIGKVRSATIQDVLRGKTGRRKKRFMQGILELRDQGVMRKDARITEMQKLEMYDSTKIATKEDRGIQFRTVKYNAALARELHNIEERVIGMHPDGYHPVMKGATPQQRAERIAIGQSRFKKPLYLLLDHSRFDAHVNEYLLDQEHRFYLRCRRGNPFLRRLLRFQYINRGRTKGGIGYVSRAKRMSGDINTGLGNTVLNYCMLRAWLNCSGVNGHIYLDGDDSVIIVEDDDKGKLLPVEEFMLNFGMVTICETVTEFWKVEFCQSKPVLVDGTVRFVRNPHKVMATVGQSAEVLDPIVAGDNLRASCLCELAMNGNCPVISKYCRRILDYVGNGPVRFSPSLLWKAEQYGIKFEAPPEVEPSDESRYTMWRAWGIDPGMQEVYEQQHQIFSGFIDTRKRKPKKLRELVYDAEEEWSGYSEPACGCEQCPTYLSDEAYHLAQLCV
nr:hypothetical protein [Nelson wasp-associated virus 1]